MKTKGERVRSEFAQEDGDQMHWKEKGLLYAHIWNFLFHNSNGSTHTHNKQPNTEAHTGEIKETEKRSMEYHQTKTTERNKKEKNQWSHRATRKQRIKWL